MNLLALDTSSEGCSAALWADGTLTDRFTVAPRGHTRLLMPMVRELLAERSLAPSDLSALAFACGPGSFTGLRIATGVVQGLAYGLDVPVIPVSSLAAVAQQVIDASSLADGTGVAVAFDARMDEVYWGCFQVRDGWAVPLAAEQVRAPEAVSLPDGPDRWVGAGSGWLFHGRMPASVTASIIAPDTAPVPRAREVALLGQQAWQRGESVPAALARPVYLRDEVTWQKLPGR